MPRRIPGLVIRVIMHQIVNNVLEFHVAGDDDGGKSELKKKRWDWKRKALSFELLLSSVGFEG